MKKQMRLYCSLVTAVSMTFATPIAWGAGGRASGVQTTGDTTGTTPSTATATTTSTTSTSTTTSSNPLTTYTGTTIDTSSQNNAIQQTEVNKAVNTQDTGKSASNAQNMGMIAGLIGAAFSGAMAAATCSKTPPDPSCPAWIMGALASALVAAAMGNAKGKSDQTVGDVTVGGGGTTPTPTPTDVTQTPEYKETERNLQAAASKVPGMQVNMKTGTVKLPDGRTLNAADLGDAKALAASGLSPSEIAGFQDAFKTAMKKGAEEAKVKGLDASTGDSFEDTFGAGGGPGSSLADSADGAGGAGGLGSGVRRDPAQVAGLTRNYNGEPIGVASENLFTLINRRYDHKAQHDTFILPGGRKKQ